MRELKDPEVRAIQVDILKKVDKWCRETGIRYFLAYGTLLGAVRHKGYIPWDDDIDLCMFRKDYEQILREFNRNRVDGLRLHHSSTNLMCPYEFAKISDETTVLLEHTDYPYDIGINIDIFVLDNLPEGEKNAAKMIQKMRLVKRLMEIKLAVVVPKKRNLIKRVLLSCGKWTCRQIPMHLLTTKMNRIACKFAAEESSKWVGDVCQRWFKPSEVMEKSWFDKTVELEFEGHCFQAPAKYDEILTAWYGDYMQLPPVEERVTHHDYKAYRKD